VNSPNPVALHRRRPRNLAASLVDSIGARIKTGELLVGAKLPSEAGIMAAFGVSRTVVREALSKLQASGLVQTRHGIGTFVVDVTDGFRIDPEQFATVRDVIAVLELRISLETEAAGLAALRRTERNLQVMHTALAAFRAAIEHDGDTVAPDFEFHFEIARATQNAHFADLMNYLGTLIIPRSRKTRAATADRAGHLRRVLAEHDSIYQAIAAQDADAARAAMRAHLANSRERLRRANRGA
jgi:GntR family transcriptional regulator, transcriptional repressor for pyruvate dehydrogenase complex